MVRYSLSCEAGLQSAFVAVWRPSPCPAAALVKSDALSLATEVKQWTWVLGVAGDPFKQSYRILGMNTC